MASFTSVENLLINLTANAPISPFSQQVYKLHQQANNNNARTNLPLAWLETSFGLNNEEPETVMFREKEIQVPENLKNQWHSTQTVNKLGIVKNVEPVSNVDLDVKNCNLPNSQKFYSMSDMHEIDPTPENTLLPKKKDPLVSCSTLMSNDTLSGSKDLHGDKYGYTVVMTAQERPCNNRTLPDIVDYQAVRMEDTFSDLQECGLLCDEYGMFEEDGESSPPKPPPYVPPPSYQDSLSNKSTKSDRTSSGSSGSQLSFVSAKSHMSPEVFHQLDITRTPGLDKAFVSEDNIAVSKVTSCQSVPNLAQNFAHTDSKDFVKYNNSSKEKVKRPLPEYKEAVERSMFLSGHNKTAPSRCTKEHVEGGQRMTKLKEHNRTIPYMQSEEEKNYEPLFEKNAKPVRRTKSTHDGVRREDIQRQVYASSPNVNRNFQEFEALKRYESTPGIIYNSTNLYM